MAHGTNTVYITRSFQLRAASIAVDLQVSTHCHRASTVTVIIGRIEIIGMRPDSICRTAIGFTLISIDDINLIDIAIAIPVIRSPVSNLLLRQVNSLNNHLTRILIIALSIILTIIASILTNCHRTNDIKVKLELSTALSLEIVSHRTLEVPLRESLLISYTIEERIVMISLKRLILEVHQNHNGFLLTQNRCGVSESPVLHALGIDFSTTHLGSLNNLLGINSYIGIALLHICLSVLSFPEVSVLIADERSAHLCAILQFQHLPLPTSCGYCHHRYGDKR